MWKIPRKYLEILEKSYQIHVCTTYLKPVSANLSWNFVTETCKQRPETTRRNYVAKNWALAMMLKALALVYFWSVLLLKEQMMTSVRKTLKILVWSAQSRSISSKFSLKITTKSTVFHRLRMLFSEVCPQNSGEIGRFFREFVPIKTREIWLFSATYQKPWILWRDPSHLKISWIEVGIHLEVNWLCLCDLAHFLWWKQSKIIWNVCFHFTLLIQI